MFFCCSSSSGLATDPCCGGVRGEGDEVPQRPVVESRRAPAEEGEDAPADETKAGPLAPGTSAASENMEGLLEEAETIFSTLQANTMDQKITGDQKPSSPSKAKEEGQAFENDQITPSPEMQSGSGVVVEDKGFENSLAPEASLADVHDAEAPTGIFVAQISRDADEPWGIDPIVSEAHSRYCIVGAIAEHGPIAAWNGSVKEAAEGEQVKVYDRLVSVNDVGGSSTQLSDGLKQAAGAVKLTFEHPLIREIAIDKQGRRLGVTFEVSPKSCGLFVREVVDGLVKETPDIQLQPGDVVVEFDGVRFSPDTLLEKMANNDTLKILVCRYSAVVFTPCSEG